MIGKRPLLIGIGIGLIISSIMVGVLSSPMSGLEGSGRNAFLDPADQQDSDDQGLNLQENDAQGNDVQGNDVQGNDAQDNLPQDTGQQTSQGTDQQGSQDIDQQATQDQNQQNPSRTGDNNPSDSQPQSDSTNAQVDDQPDNPGTITVTIVPGSNASMIADTLLDHGLIKDKQEFLERVLSRGVASKFIAGTFELSQGLELDALIDRLLQLP